MKEERDRLYREQEIKIKEKNIRTEEISIGELKLD